MDRLAKQLYNANGLCVTINKSGPRDKLHLTISNGVSYATGAFEPRELWRIGAELAGIGRAMLDADPRLETSDLKALDVPGPPAIADAGTERAKQVKAALEQYADDSEQTFQALERMCSEMVIEGGKKPRAATREELLAKIVGEENLDEVVAGKMSVRECLDAQEPPEELEAFSETEVEPLDGDSIRA